MSGWGQKHQSESTQCVFFFHSQWWPSPGVTQSSSSTSLKHPALRSHRSQTHRTQVQHIICGTIYIYICAWTRHMETSIWFRAFCIHTFWPGDCTKQPSVTSVLRWSFFRHRHPHVASRLHRRTAGWLLPGRWWMLSREPHLEVTWLRSIFLFCIITWKKQSQEKRRSERTGHNELMNSHWAQILLTKKIQTVSSPFSITERGGVCLICSCCLRKMIINWELKAAVRHIDI